MFKHALTQEVVYESLPVAHRHALHAAAARALERLYEGRLEEADDRLAYHYARTDQADRAVECLSRVAEKAARGHAHAEALGRARGGARPRRAAPRRPRATTGASASCSARRRR